VWLITNFLILTFHELFLIHSSNVKYKMTTWHTWYNWLFCRPSSPCSTGGSCTRHTAALSGQNPTHTYDHLQQWVSRFLTAPSAQSRLFSAIYNSCQQTETTWYCLSERTTIHGLKKYSINVTHITQPVPHLLHYIQTHCVVIM